MTNLLVGILIPLIGVAVPALIVRYLPNEKVYAFFKKTGVFISNYCGTKIGSGNWEKIENSLETTLVALFEGLIDGLNQDDKKRD